MRVLTRGKAACLPEALELAVSYVGEEARPLRGRELQVPEVAILGIAYSGRYSFSYLDAAALGSAVAAGGPPRLRVAIESFLGSFHQVQRGLAGQCFAPQSSEDGATLPHLVRVVDELLADHVLRGGDRRASTAEALPPGRPFHRDLGALTTVQQP